MAEIRNFPIIAYIDHGKSTLADRVIQIGVDARDAVQVSAKSGAGVDDLLGSIVRSIPPPRAGKKRMKQVGRVEIPQQAFLAVLQVGRGR